MDATPKTKVMSCGENDSLADVILRIRKDKMDLIVQGLKNHEYRTYRLDTEVKKIWLYVDEDETIPYLFETSEARVPGEVNDPNGVGNKEFDLGLKESKFGYPILALYELPHPLTVDELLEDYGVDMRDKRQYVKEALVNAFPVEDLKRVVHN